MTEHDGGPGREGAPSQTLSRALTSISSGSSAGRSRPMPAATWTRGFVET